MLQKPESTENHYKVESEHKDIKTSMLTFLRQDVCYNCATLIKD